MALNSGMMYYCFMNIHSKTIVTFGEIMLRLRPPDRELLFQSPVLETVFGGSEANVAVSVAMLGGRAVYVTALPSGAVGDAAVRSLRSYGVDVRAYRTEGRMGIYYLEGGACQRPSQVIYDRDGSCFAVSGPDKYDWDEVFTGAGWFHLSGVTPAVSQCACDCGMAAVRAAGKNGAVVSLDLNYRNKLWRYGKGAPGVLREFARNADVIIANEEDIQKCLGISLNERLHTDEAYRELCDKVKEQFPNVRMVAVTLRFSYSADRNGWSAVLSGESGYYQSRQYDIENIVERVGAGDSFAAALIYALTEWHDEQQALEFAAASSCLKHSIPGDFNLAVKEQVLALMNGNGTGRIQR
jgi:2-dehydro-3-deoxygluconokinase